MLLRTGILVFIVFTSLLLEAQQPADTILKFPDKYIDAVSSKATSLENKLDKKSEKALSQLKKQDEKIIRKLSKIDSSKAKEFAVTAKARYEQLEAKLKNPGKLTHYIAGLDSLSTTLGFLNSNNPLLAQTKKAKDKLNGALNKVDGLKSQLQKAEDIKTFLKERKEYLKEQLGKLGFAKELKQVNKQAYYYAQQLSEYKQILNDPKKIERKVLELLSHTKAWANFFRKHSILSSLFRLPDPDQPADMSSLAGLQTRSQVNALIQSQVAAGGPNAQQVLQQNLQAAQSQLNQLKDKVLKAGGGSSDKDMPEGFKPNEQKTKSFWKRLEYGTNLQTQKGSNYYPNRADLGLSLGYKLNGRSVVGIGANWSAGLGKGWNHIAFTSEGVGLRSFIDWKIKNSWWLAGGYEQNFRQVPQIGSGGAVISQRWGMQESGLIGISKKVSLKTKFFKQTSIKVFWDFLSYRAVPRTQPVVFRIGYNF